MHKVSMIMDDGSFSTRTMDDYTLAANIDRFRDLMSKKYGIIHRNNTIMAIEDNGAFVLGLEWSMVGIRKA